MNTGSITTDISKALPIPPPTYEDKAHEIEMELADVIRQEVLLYAERIGHEAIAGKLGLNQIKLKALLSRKHWTLRFAIITGIKLNFNINACMTMPE